MDKVDEKLEEKENNREEMNIDMTSLNKEWNAKIKEYNNWCSVFSLYISGRKSGESERNLLPS